MQKVSIKTNSEGVVNFDVEVARTMEERERGLMFRNFLEKEHGMFFVFEKPEITSFWMKHTKIPLDIIFIDENFKIVHIEKHAEPCPETALNCPIYSSKVPIKYVLEIAADLATSMGISEGNPVNFL